MGSKPSLVGRGRTKERVTLEELGLTYSVSILCTLLATATLALQYPPPVLDTKIEVSPGGNAIYQTTYTLSSPFGSSQRELWRILQGEVYIHHWISPNGNVWVASTGRQAGRALEKPPLRDAIRIWVRDRNADLLASFEVSFKDENWDALDPAAIRMRSFRPWDAEEMIIPDRSGNELRLLIYREPEDGRRHAISRMSAKGSPDSLLEEALDTQERTHEITSQIGGGRWGSFWESGSKHWFVARPAESREKHRVGPETLLAGKPHLVGPLPTGHLLVSTEEHGNQKIAFINLAHGRVDYSYQMGGSQGAPVRDVRAFNNSGRWISLDEATQTHSFQNPAAAASVEFWDYEGYRHQLDIFCPPGRFEVMAHKSEIPLAQRPAEAQFGRLVYTDEKFLFDPKRQFMARTRTYGPQPYDTLTTMFRRRGKHWVELWSERIGSDHQQAQILENGTLVVVDKSEKGPYIRFISTNFYHQLFELVGPAGYASKEDAEKFFSPTTLTVEAVERDVSFVTGIGDHRGMVYIFKYPIPDKISGGEICHWSNGWDQSRTWWSQVKSPEKPNGNLR